MSKKTAINPTRDQNYPEWYQQVIQTANLAENSPVRGCMIIKPYGFTIWENMQRILDQEFKKTGHVNAYFPLLIPLSYIEKEAEHVSGFAKECAVVTHHRLEEKDGKLVPEGKLEEPFVIRPTSETIIGECYSRWVQSYRDLPILINQWANVMRWEMRTRLFLRTSEFLWQEGHTAHATGDEALEETLKMLDVYERFAEDVMAMPVIAGEKTKDERFPGALQTFTIEAMMQDGKALQAGTSHFLGQNFAKASEIKFTDQNGEVQHAWTTSWGVSTRLIGGLIMTHSDDNGLVLPPKLAPYHIMIIPIYRNDSEKDEILKKAKEIQNNLSNKFYNNTNIIVKIDDRDLTSGERNWQAIKTGVPVRIELGPRDLAKNQICVARRDKEPNEKQFLNIEEFIEDSANILDSIQNSLFAKAKGFIEANTHEIKSLDELKKYFKKDSSTGFVCCYSTNELDEKTLKLLKELKISARCIPNKFKNDLGDCIFTGKPNCNKIIFAKAY